MYVFVLGSAAGGGFPQWNCHCQNCSNVRTGHPGYRPRTQSSIAISEDGMHWLLVNASPDIRQQLATLPHGPTQSVRQSPVQAVLLSDAQMDHVTGLVMLREGYPMDLFCTPSVQQELSQHFPLLPVLSHWNDGLLHQPLPEHHNGSFQVSFLPELAFSVIPLRSNAPPYSPRRDAPQAGDNIGLMVRDRKTGTSLFYAPGLGELTPELLAVMAQADCLLVDGTFWSEDEMRLVGLSHKQARDLGHLPLEGKDGMIELLAGFPAARKIFIHIINPA
ncbi:MAG: pyrroloquinoline quinone biosynthesis protein PqqB [Pseudomonadota bacterium]|nr:pyrroloquinoline quinone biosynthesis protein PqqB [Pseudomonadota bacterium]